MNIIGIKELQENPDKLSWTFSKNDYLLMTQRGKPMGLALPFSSDFIGRGIKPWIALKAFEMGYLSLGQLAKTLEKTKVETMEMLGRLNIPLASYDLQEDLDAIDKMSQLIEKLR